MQKRQRWYSVIIQTGDYYLGEYSEPDNTIEINYPITARFDLTIQKNGSNGGVLQLYNLNSATQAKLWKDNYDKTRYVIVYIYAGYYDTSQTNTTQPTPPLIFAGEALQCYSYRPSGSTDFITEFMLDAKRHLYKTFNTLTMHKGTPFEGWLDVLMTSSPVLHKGYTSSKIPALKTNQTFMGKTIDLLTDEFADYDIFVDKGQLNILNPNEVIPGQIQVITSESGLLGSPRRSEQFLELDMIFEPLLQLGQKIRLISTTLNTITNINTDYVVWGLRHAGIISPTQSGELITTVTLYLGGQLEEVDEPKKFNDVKDSPQNVTWLKPVSGRVSSKFHEFRQPPRYKKTYYHDALDIDTGGAGTPIKAMGNGIASTGFEGGGYGNFVVLNHGNHNGTIVTSYYAHMQSIAIKSGQNVAKGDIIGYVGNTGASSGAHLHFEVRENNRKVNPEKYVGAY